MDEQVEILQIKYHVNLLLDKFISQMEEVSKDLEEIKKNLEKMEGPTEGEKE